MIRAKHPGRSAASSSSSSYLTSENLRSARGGRFFDFHIPGIELNVDAGDQGTSGDIKTITISLDVDAADVQ